MFFFKHIQWDTDPGTPLNPDPVRVRIWIRIHNCEIFSCKFFHFWSSKPFICIVSKSGWGLVFSQNCWIWILNQWIRIVNTEPRLPYSHMMTKLISTLENAVLRVCQAWSAYWWVAASFLTSTLLHTSTPLKKCWHKMSVPDLWWIMDPKPKNHYQSSSWRISYVTVRI